MHEFSCLFMPKPCTRTDFKIGNEQYSIEQRLYAALCGRQYAAAMIMGYFFAKVVAGLSKTMREKVFHVFRLINTS